MWGYGEMIWILFFASGFAGLVYEVLWMKELGLLFGNTAQAAATTLAAFFLGLVVGARWWGRRVEGVDRPLRTYAWLEVGVAVSALLYFVLLDAYHAVYSSLFQFFGDTALPFLAVKLVLALGVLFPPSFFMGGTLPAMSQHLVRRRDALGRTGSTLYGVNTLGATCGAFAAGFFLPRLVGFDRSYLVAVATTAAVAVAAWWLARRAAPDEDRDAAFPQRADDRGGARGTSVGDPAVADGDAAGWSPGLIRGLALVSGFASLSLEVLWTRMFAQVLQNSVYTFSTILVTFLLALALGAALARWLIRKAWEPATLVLLLVTLSALLVGASPFVLYGLTDGLAYFGGERGFVGYVVGTFLLAFGVMLPPGILLGTLFPYLLRLAEPFARSPGRTVGELSAINTAGAVAGSLTAGFVLLDLFGLWASIRLIAVAYICVALLVASRLGVRGRLLRGLPVAGLLLLVTFLDPAGLPVVHVEPLEKGESVLRTWEGSSGIVAVVRQPESLTIKLDNDYSLGGTGAAVYEEGQAHLPLWLHPDPDSVFFLGMGTGITAGAALLHPVEEVVVSELAPDVVEAARTFFEPYLHDLFRDPRATVISEDGRNVLLGTAQRFDVVIADLFMTWKAGVGSLYSLEHYRTARDRLREGGLYVQWLPMYQISRKEFGIVARTMTEVFPQVTLWRGAIAPGWETAALIGHRRDTPLDPEALARRLERSGEIEIGSPPGRSSDPAAESTVKRFTVEDLMLQYCGNVSAARALLEPYPVNTDDRPVIEYEAPITHRRSRAHRSSWFVGADFVRFLGELQGAVPPESDPYLRRLSPPQTAAVRAGLQLYLARVLDRTGEHEAAWKAMEEFRRLYRGEGGPGSDGGEMATEAEQSRRELLELIETYERRIRALREHLREVERGAEPPA